MLSLTSKAELRGWSSPPLLKVAGLAEFASGEFSVQRMILDLRNGTEGLAGLLALPWAGLLVDDSSDIPDHFPSVRLLSDQAIAKPGDVLELMPSLSKVGVRYRRGDNGNVLFATERCNSFCLMCSQPPRQVEDTWRVEQLCELIDLIDRQEPSLAISGGEPTLLGDALVRVLRKCADTLPDTRLHILSNGRNFDQPGFADQFSGVHPSLTWGIPLYGDHFGLHDFIVQSRRAFAQTIRGLYALHTAGQRIEIRVVLVKPTVQRLGELARYILRNLPFVEHIALMGVEPIGFAKANRDALWIDPADAAGTIVDATEFLAERGMQVSLYNLPLCALPSRVWGFARRSISNWKQDYLPACSECDIRERCGGFFGWVTPEWTSRSISPIRGERTNA